MPFFGMPYRVLFDDTMAYGSHHFLTNFKFQCEAREHFFFREVVEQSPDGKAVHDDILILTQQGYCRNLAPVQVGERVGILLSIEEPTSSSVRMCFRVVRFDGKPVSCGFQSLVCLSRRSGEIISAPETLVRAMAPLREKLFAPSFRDRVLAGTSMQELFNREVIELGVAVARESGPKIVPEVCLSQPARSASDIVFMFPGQGAWKPELLREVCRVDPNATSALLRADEIARSLLGESVSLLVTAADAEMEELLSRCADLAQVGNYLTGVLTARYLMSRGLQPAWLFGHSAGELTALAVGGAYSLDTGVELICQRIRALQSVRGSPSGMLALACGTQRVRALLEALGPVSLNIAVVNHPDQTVVSGPLEELNRLAAVAESLNLTHIRLASRYPFHSRLLRYAVAPFRDALRTLRFEPLRLPVYSPLGRGPCPSTADWAEILPSHFVQPFAFHEAVEDVYRLGGRTFIECGPGRVLTNLVRTILRDQPGVAVHATASGSENSCELSRVLEACAKGSSAPREKTNAEPLSSADTSEPVSAATLPIAIIALGSILPGAMNAEQLWRNLLRGTSGIVDLAEIDPTLATDFKAQGTITSDKTYSLLCGRVGNLPDDAGTPVYSPNEFTRLSIAQQFLAATAVQCLANVQKPLPSPSRIHVVLGSTADGLLDYDRALMVARAQAMVRDLTIPDDVKAQFCDTLETAFGQSLTNAGELAPHPSYSSVVRRVVGDGVKVLAVDAACASSIYAIDLGMRALRSGECDLAICGGVFAPGLANTCLFAQFGGLSTTGSRPFDATADGVVFGEGAALIALKRLPDALAAGDSILAVVRGIGTSSDGKSPSVMEPKREGQLLALQRASACCGVEPKTVQYVEAHATATPVGDAVELEALCEAFGSRGPPHPRIELGSLKGLIGHTGWLAGAASVVKLCAALRERTIPPQPNFSAAAPSLKLEGSPFVIAKEARRWPANGGFPRRAGVNGFGFGGTNAHLLLEEFNRDYHRRFATTPATPLPSAEAVAVVGLGVILPDSESLLSEQLQLPPNVLILPDVADHMDRGQVLALRAAHQALAMLPSAWETLRAEVGVILGFEGKTRRGIDAALRVHHDFLCRRLNETRGSVPLSDEAFASVRDQLLAAIQRLLPSGPYTLPGLMPNVIAGRIANAFNLGGPNMVLDAERSALFEALAEASQVLRFGDCKFVLAGAVSSSAGPDVDVLLRARRQAETRPSGDAAIVLALTSVTTARELKLPVQAFLSSSAESAGVSVLMAGSRSPVCLMGAEGAVELAVALNAPADRQTETVIEWRSPDGRKSQRLTVTRHQPPADDLPDDVAELLKAPLLLTAPIWARQESSAHRPLPLLGRRILVLTDQPPSAELSQCVRHLEHRYLCPAGVSLSNAVAADLSSQESLEGSLRGLDDWPYDTILVVLDLSKRDPLQAVTGPESILLSELLFASARHAYARLETGEVIVGAVCLSGVDESCERLHPCTGLVSGFLHSLARELPRATCKQVNTAAGDISGALALLEEELAEGPLPAPVEVCYTPVRFVSRTEVIEQTPTGSPMLNRESVVLVTGGARGVTAVLAETLLRRFGCTIVLVGRTDPTTAPAEVLAMDEVAFERFEAEFYQRELGTSPDRRMAELKQHYQTLRSAREVSSTLRLLSALPGTVRYHQANVTDAAAVDLVVRRVLAEFGRLDMIVHGAGIQSSKVLPEKKLGEFRGIIATKLGGLGNLLGACERHFHGRRIHFHLVTSTFSQLGNAGQEDYGAANVAMDRVAHHLTQTATNTDGSSLGWLGWFHVGMTRGSEYVNLALLRRLRGITRTEGEALFDRWLSASPARPVVHVMTRLEADYFGVEFSASQALIPAACLEKTWIISCDTHPFLLDHALSGMPTLPGTYEVELAARTAMELRPGMHLHRFDNLSMERYVKVRPGERVNVRAVAEVLEERAEEVRIAVRLLTDFVHTSGQVLQKDILHFATEVCLTAQPRLIPAQHAGHEIHDGWRLPDPYLHPESPLVLTGAFRCLRDIRVGLSHSTALCLVKHSAANRELATGRVPVMLLDGTWRFSVIGRDEDDTASVYVPRHCGTIEVSPGVNDQSVAKDECTLTCNRARREGEHIFVDWAEVTTSTGQTVFSLRNLVGYRIGKVPSRAESLLPRPPSASRPTADHSRNGNESVTQSGNSGISNLDLGRVAPVFGPEHQPRANPSETARTEGEMNTVNTSRTPNPLAEHAPPDRNWKEFVTDIIADVTRYPRTILIPSAHLEEDLGIDSVKRAEILAVLSKRLKLPETTKVAPAKLRTIGEVIAAVELHVRNGTPAPANTELPQAAPPGQDQLPPTVRMAASVASSLPIAPANGLDERVLDLIAEVTRHPRHILQLSADLEDDLGIDARKRAEILSAMRTRLKIPVPENGTIPRSIGDIVALVRASQPVVSSSATVRRTEGEVPKSSPTAAPGVWPLSPNAFQGKIALVTGSGHGLGKVIARQLARLGASVIVNSFHSRVRGEQTTAEISAEGGRAVHLWGSVANTEQLQQLFREIETRFGALDYYVSNASNGILARLRDVTVEHWDRAFRTNVVALHQGSLLAAELMRKRGGGKIVAISSNGAQRYLDYFGCMGPVKAAMEALVRYLAIELGPDNIQVNAISAGPIYGELLDKYPDRDKLGPRWEAMVPRGRLNNEQEVADAVMFLLTNTGINGTVLPLDAGGGHRISSPLED